ncbi:hypothetical protein GGI00_002121 [Coemansia sp. RSA 2681]|nr:hypothetical protein GGI00_002121 [Coemansia sp. RSA 2681]
MSLETLVKELTETGLDTLNAEKLTALKRICKRNDETPPAIVCVFQALLKALSKDHAQVRISSLQAVNELFERSHQFRLLVIGDLPHILGLIFGAYQRPLPRPSEFAAKLKRLAAEYMYAWTERYGAAYQRLVQGFRYLRYVEGVDFRVAARTFKRNDPVRVERLRKGWAENRSEYMERTLLAVRAEFQGMRLGIEEAVWMLNRCFAILVPDIADLFGNPSGPCRVEDDGSDVEEIMAVMAVNRHAVDINVDPGRIIETEENGDNAAVYDVIRDYLWLCIKKYEPRLAAWTERLERLDSGIGPAAGVVGDDEEEEVLESVRKLKSRVSDVVAKCADLGVVDISHLHSGNGESTSDDEFEAVPADYHKHSRRRQTSCNTTSSSEALDARRRHQYKQHPVFSLLGEAGLESDPTYVRPELLRKAPAKRRQADANSSSSNPAEDKLRQTAPIVEYGPDLMYWGQDTVDANTSGLEIRHRFLGSAREEAVLSGDAVDNLRKRVVYYSDAIAGVNGSSASQTGGRQEREEIRACRAPLKGGRLCPRRDLLKCPFHGPIVDRDEAGRTQGGFVAGEEREEEEEEEELVKERTRLMSTVATAETVGDLEWRDVEALVNSQQAKRQQKKKEPAAEKSALVDIRKRKQPSSLSRLQAQLRKKQQR